MRFSSLLLVLLVALAPVTYAWIGTSLLPRSTHRVPSALSPRRAPISSLRASHFDVEQTTHQSPNVNPNTKMPVKQSGAVAPNQPVQSQGQTKVHPMSILEMRLRPLIEWKQTETGFLISCATPGLPKEDINLEVVDQPVPPTSRWTDEFDIWSRDPLTSVFFGGEPNPPATGAVGHYLIISGESKQKEKPVDEKKSMGFRATYAKFQQRIRLPDNIDKSTLSATYENGMLLVHVNYRQPERIETKRLSVPIH